MRNASFLRSLEAALVDYEKRGATDNSRADYRSRNGAVVVEAKMGVAGTRDIYAAIAQLALIFTREPKVHRALLVLWRPRITRERLTKIWRELEGVFDKQTVLRMDLIAVWDAESLTIPETAESVALAKRLQATPATEGSGRSDLSFEVLKVLLDEWFTARRPISITDLQAATGLSYPSVAKSIRALGSAIERTSNRSVRLTGFPGEAWARLLALAPRVRRTLLFEDRSKRSTAHALLERFHHTSAPHVALGGVEAARHWHRKLGFGAFDLEGQPRVDLCVHAPRGALDLAFVRRLDPALARVESSASPILVVHRVQRARDLFDVAGRVRYADVVETLLDLAEQRTLRHQYDELLQHLRAKR